jgi:predicted subunit of tRNA(5-methylaminomethyl-2-thiouridylate) methyltransferase
MNFTFTWILDKFGFQPKIETFEFPVKQEAKPVAKKTTKVAVKKTVKKATTRTKK